MSRNAIKYLAMAAMFCNHFAYIFLKEGSTGQEVMVDIGYFTAITICCIQSLAGPFYKKYPITH